MLYEVPAASQMLSAAPVPRPPQPISPTLMVSFALAWALGRNPRPAAAAVVAWRKTRRFEDGVESVMRSISRGSGTSPAVRHDESKPGPRSGTKYGEIRKQ